MERQFIDCIKTGNSEIFLQILCFLYEQMPFSAKNIETLKLKYNMTNDEEYEKLSASFRKFRNKNNNSIRIKTPKNTTMLSPAGLFIKHFSKIRKFSLNENSRDVETRSTSYSNYDNTISGNSSAINSNSPKLKEEKEYNDIISDIDLNLTNKKNGEIHKNDFVRLNNENIYKAKGNEEKNVKEILKKSKEGYYSPTKYLEEKPYINHLAINNNKSYAFKSLNTINEKDENDETIEYLNEEKEVKYENWIFKKTNSGRLRKYCLVLINKDSYYYQSNDKTNYLGMHNLSGCFIQENIETEIIDGVEYYLKY